MNDPQEIVLDRSLFPGGWTSRLWFLYVTAVLPAIDFAFSFQKLNLVDWKDPALSTWPNLLLDRPGSMGFLPVAVVVAVTCCFVVWKPGPWVRSFAIRVILGLGILLAFQYCLLILASLLLDNEFDLGRGLFQIIWAFLLIETASILLAITWRWLRVRYLSRIAKGWLYAIPVALWLIGTSAFAIWKVTVEERSLQEVLPTFLWPLGALFILSILVGPLWTLNALLRLHFRLGSMAPLNLGRSALATVGLGGYLLAWRVALLEAMAAYEKLPDEPPSCFIATAAAQGPAWLVGGVATQTESGRILQITPQLQRFKLFELVLQVAAPRLHCSLRRSYDRFGAQWAEHIRTSHRAAATWLLLKPVEGFAATVTRLIAGSVLSRRRARLYRAIGAADRRITRPN